MKKVFSLTVLIGIILLIFALMHTSQRASGEAKNISIGVDEQYEIEQVGPPWFNEAWHYRRPILITNIGAPIPYYQVLIKLDSTNFNFELANTDGLDIRFTDSSGKNPISFWKESWDKQNKLAYFWVLVSNLSPEPYKTTIYLYYNNPTITQTTSNGLTTFDFFEDSWCQFPGAGCTLGDENPNNLPIQEIYTLQNDTTATNPDRILVDPWIVISGSPDVSGGIVNLSAGEGIKTANTFQYYAVGFKANYGLGNGLEWGGFVNGASGQQTIIGDLSSDTGNMYLRNHVTIDDNRILPRVGGVDWHNSDNVYEVRWRSGQSSGDINHGASSATSTTQVPNTTLPVTLYSYTGSNAIMKVDWIYVRQYRNPEPTVLMGAAQGLVDLGMTITDTPDPLPNGKKLTYQLVISNPISIDAPGVVLTDTLPGNVQLFSVAPEGVCGTSQPIVCNINEIPANSTAGITIVVIPNTDGVITNNATVGSLGYELDLSNNTTQTMTLVDSVKPVVNWEKPVLNRQTYVTSGGLVTLEASATDNDQIARVEFWRYDGSTWVYINTSYTPPYQIPFDTSILTPNIQTPIEVYAYDRAGNQSALDPEVRQVIYIKRIFVFLSYLPIALK